MPHCPFNINAMGAVTLDKVRIIAVYQAQEINYRPLADWVQLSAKGGGPRNYLPGFVCEARIASRQQGFHV